MKYFYLFILLIFNCLSLFSHPILQNNLTVKIKDNLTYEISTSINLAFLLCQDSIGDFQKFDKEYKRLLALSNEDFCKEALAREKEILSKYTFGFNNIKSESNKIEIDKALRKQQIISAYGLSESLTHSDELCVVLKIFGEIKPNFVSSFYWENPDPIRVDMLKVTIGDNEEPAIVWVPPLEKKEISLTNLPTKTLDVIREYITQGLLHIIPKGLDHILFMLCLFFLFKSWKSLLLQISIFTIAHSITLALVTMNVFSFKSTIVEPLIALSICVVGIENLFSDKINKFRISLIFIFGLLHGMGFADALSKLGLPENKLAVSLISFNIGVEFGQIAVVTITYLVLGHWFYKKDWYRNRITIPCSILISLFAFYLFVTRLQTS
jgi:hydrogenase/urease accessory protein HupE